MNRQHIGTKSIFAAVILLILMAVSGCRQSVSELTVEIDPATDVVAIIFRNHGDRAAEVDDQFLRDYPGTESSLQLSVSRDGEPMEQCRSMDYLGPPKVSKVMPGADAVFETHISALIHSFCLYEPGDYSLQVSLAEPERSEVVSNTAGFVVTQEEIDHHVSPKDSTR